MKGRLDVSYYHPDVSPYSNCGINENNTFKPCLHSVISHKPTRHYRLLVERSLLNFCWGAIGSRSSCVITIGCYRSLAPTAGLTAIRLRPMRTMAMTELRVMDSPTRSLLSWPVLRLPLANHPRRFQNNQHGHVRAKMRGSG